MFCKEVILIECDKCYYRSEYGVLWEDMRDIKLVRGGWEKFFREGDV